MVENLTEICDETEESILCTLSNRFLNKRIYTQLGDNLIFINPNELLPIYDESVIQQYARNKERYNYQRSSIAHIYATANKVLQNVENGSKQESLIFCGESGSGKTANFFHTMRFLCANEKSNFNIPQVNALQKIYESFGCAKTIKNDCSTRFGCLVKLAIKRGIVDGFTIKAPIPIEMSKLVSQRKGNFNFGIFYQLCSGFSTSQRNKYGIKKASNYFYLNQGKCQIDETLEEKKFKILSEALSIIGFSNDQKELIFTILSAILHIGNIFFYTQTTINGEEYAEIANENVVQWVTYLLAIDYEELKRVLIGSDTSSKQDESALNNSSIIQLKSIDSALDARDTLAKILYENLFEWILSKISLFYQNGKRSANNDVIDGVIMLYDMFGFEKYNLNGYDELCVNAASEKLEHFYLTKTFSPILREKCEGKQIEEITAHTLIKRNRQALELLTIRPCGIFPLLDDECKFPKSSEKTFFQRCNLNNLNKNAYVKSRVRDKMEFGIRHIAGTVFYNIDGFLARNHWRRLKEIASCLHTSKDPMLAFVFGKKHVDERCAKKLEYDENSECIDYISSSVEETSTIYIATNIYKSLDSLIEQFEKSNCTFIRCVRSNADRQLNKFDILIVQRQIWVFAAFDICQMLRHAFVYRFTWDEFSDEMRCLLPDEVTRGKSASETMRAILDTQGVDALVEARIDKGLVYLKERLWRQLQELKEFTRNVAALILQRNFRKWISLRNFAYQKKAVIILQSACRAWKARKIADEKRHKILENIQMQNAISQTRIFPNSTKMSKNTLNEENELFSELPESLRIKLLDNCTDDYDIRQVTQYLPINSDTPRPIVNRLTIEQFAEQNLKYHVLGSRREPIFAPFLSKMSDEEFSDSIIIFKAILRYMNDTSLDLAQSSTIAQFIIQKGIDQLNLRDEIYVQLCNQTYHNCSEISTTRAWNLMLMAVNAFPPGILVFPMLYSYFQSVRPIALSNMLINALTRPLVALCPVSRSRLFAPSKFEQISIERRQPTVINTRLCNGESFDVEADSWTTIKEFTYRVLRNTGIGDSEGWCIELCDENYAMKVAHGIYIFDAITRFTEPNTCAKIEDNCPKPFAIIRLQNNTTEKTNEQQNGYTKSSINNKDTFNVDINPRLRRVNLNDNSLNSISALNDAYLLRRQNPNCMSRITEEEFALDGSREATLTRNQALEAHQPKDYPTLSITSHIRNTSIPTTNGDVDKFLDEIFSKALPSIDYEDCSPLRSAALVEKIAASIKGGHKHDEEYNYLNKQNEKESDYKPPFTKLISPASNHNDKLRCDYEENLHLPQSPQYFSNDVDYNHIKSKDDKNCVAVGRQIVYNGKNYYKTPQINNLVENNKRTRYPYTPPNENLKISQLNDKNNFNLNQRSSDKTLSSQTKNDVKRLNGLRRCAPLQMSPSINSRINSEESFYGHSIASDYDKYSELQQHVTTPGKLRRSVTDNHDIYSKEKSVCSESHNIYGSFAGNDIEDDAFNDWVHEAELSNTDIIASMNKSENSLYFSPKEIQTIRSHENNVSNKILKPQAIKGRPAIMLTHQPFTVTVRKEIFFIDEDLEDGTQIDLIFAQIINDCKRGIPLHIRNYEREIVNQILRSHKIRPSSLANLFEIATKVKMQVINAARKWPLYFCRFYPIIEERPNDRTSLLLGISETGIRLISLSDEADASMFRNNRDAIIQDHFEYSDISELVIENKNSLRLITRQSISVVITSIHAQVIKASIEQYINGIARNKRYMIAIANYVTNEPDLLSFEQGQFIQLMSAADTKRPISGNWLYGKLEDKFGWFPTDYVQPVTDENQHEDEYQPFSIVKQQSKIDKNMSKKLDQLDAEFYTGALNEFNNQSNENYTTSSTDGHESERERYTMAEFAVRFFRRGGDNFGISRKKKDWTWKEITDKVKFVDHPISHSLLRLGNAEADKLAVEAFLCIMRYMGDESLKRLQTFTDCVYELLSICHRYAPMRDEVYCQIIKQITANRSTRQSTEESQVRGWRLLSIITAYFPCSSTLKPYLVKYLTDVAHDNRRLFHGIAKQCLYHLMQSFRYGGRRLILSAAEVEAITNGKNVRRQVYHLPGGHRRVIHTRTVTVAQQIMQEVCLEMNIRSIEEQQEFTLCYILEKDNTMKTLNNNEYILDVVTELEASDFSVDYIFILTRSVWIHPLRFDSKLYTDALFFQIMPNYIAGLLTSLCNGSVTAATSSDVTRLGALLLLSDPLNSCVDDISATNIATLVPKTILRFGTLNAEKWAARIRAEVHMLNGFSGEMSSKYTPYFARQEFLEIVSKWPLFGSGFFFVRRVITKRQNIMECVISINRDGVRILTNETHECLAHYLLSEIDTTNKYSISESHFIEIRLTQAASEKYGFDVFTIESELGLDITRILGQYLYLSNGGHGDNKPIYILDNTNFDEHIQ